MLLASLKDASTALGASGGGVELHLHPLSIPCGDRPLSRLMEFPKPVLFEPMLRLFEEREKKIDGAKHKARTIDEDAAKALAAYEAGLADAKQKAGEIRDRLRAEGLKKEVEVLEQARRLSGATLDEGKRKAHDEANGVRKELLPKTQELAREVATRVLGREVRG